MRDDADGRYRDLVAEMAALAEAQRGTEQRMAALADAQRATEQRIAALAEQLASFGLETGRRFEQLASQIAVLVELLDRDALDIGKLKGMSLEIKYGRKAASFFGRIVRGIRTLSFDELGALLDRAVDQGQLTQVDADDIIQTDLVVRGRRRDDGSDVYLLVEVSWGIGHEDVERAAKRARLLAKLGTPAIPVVAGDWIHPDVSEHARAEKTWRVTNGRVSPPESFL